MKKMEPVPYHKRMEQLLVQFKEVKILHFQRVINARADVLAALAASLSIPDGEVIHIIVAESRLLTHLSEMSSKSTPEGACSVKMTEKTMEDW